MSTKPLAFTTWPAELPVTYGPFRAVVDRCHDGDTFLALFDLGCDKYAPIWVRVFGVNAPELSKPGGPEARDFLSGLLPRDKPCVIESRGWSFDRLVGSVQLADGTDVADALVDSGHAVYVDY